MALSAKHQAFIDRYLVSFNAREAYQFVYGDSQRQVATSSGWRLLQNADIAEAIKRRLQESAMSADEVLMRLAEHARSDINDYLDDNGSFDLAKARRAAKTKMLKKLKTKVTTRRHGDTEVETAEVEFELYDAQSALVQIGKHYKLFTDKTEIEHSGTIQATVTVYMPENNRD